MEERPWRGWLVSLLVGAAVAVLALGWLGRGRAPAAVVPAVENTARERNSVGFELVLRFQVLLPDKTAQGET